MRKLLNTLYVTTPDAYISKDGLNLVVSNAAAELLRIPAVNIEAVNTFGYMGVSPGAMRLCAEQGIALSFFSPQGRFIGRFQGPVTGNILLRHTQHTLFANSPEAAMHLARTVTAAKIYNSRVALRRFLRDYPDSPKAAAVERAAERLKVQCRMARVAETPDALRGIEGEAAAEYFAAFPALILRSEPAFQFNGRNRRPPADPVNAMLSFGYSLLAADCAAALEGVGLDPALGFLHTMRPGRKSLALDIMEEMRSYIVDRHVLSLVNNRQVSASDFHIHHADDDPGRVSVILTDDGRKKFLAAWQQRKKSEITHPFLNEKIPLGLLPHAQALLLARHLRGDIDDYPPFFAK